jgi:hypothetical protein
MIISGSAKVGVVSICRRRRHRRIINVIYSPPNPDSKREGVKYESYHDEIVQKTGTMAQGQQEMILFIVNSSPEMQRIAYECIRNHPAGAAATTTSPVSTLLPHFIVDAGDGSFLSFLPSSSSTGQRGQNDRDGRVERRVAVISLR